MIHFKRDKITLHFWGGGVWLLSQVGLVLVVVVAVAVLVMMIVMQGERGGKGRKGVFLVLMRDVAVQFLVGC